MPSQEATSAFAIGFGVGGDFTAVVSIFLGSGGCEGAAPEEEDLPGTSAGR